jgi:hypothetical protein
MLDIAPVKSLLQEAKTEALDVVVIIDLVSKRAGTKTTREITMHIYEVAGGKVLWESKPLSEAKVAVGRRSGSDPGAKLVDQVMAYVDDKVKLQDLPELKPEAVKARVGRLTASPPSNIWPVLVELRAYQVRKLLSADEAAAAYSRVLGSDDAGEMLAIGDELGRYKAIARLLPRER